MRSAAFALTCASLVALASRADAAVLYTTTNLGAGYSLQATPDGHTFGVANASGSVVYAFDKSPVTAISQRIDAGIGSHVASFTLYTLQNGDHRVGYMFDYLGGYSGNYPTFEGYSSGWATNPGESPVLDINKTGQVVGTSSVLAWNGPTPRYAGFSDVNGQSHGFPAPMADNLNNYIVPIQGVNLDSAFKIDDLGRILASGSDGHDYLLTPVALGNPSAVPEPASCLLLGVFAAGAAIAHRARRPSSRAPGLGG